MDESPARLQSRELRAKRGAENPNGIEIIQPALGYDIREARDKMGSVTSFEIDGIPEELCERFAKRREEIEREIERFEAKHGREPSPAEIARIARETRRREPQRD